MDKKLMDDEREVREAMAKSYPWEDCDWEWFVAKVPSLLKQIDELRASSQVRRAEAFVYGVLNPDTLAIEDVGIFSNWAGFDGALPQHVMTRDLSKPMVVIDRAVGADILECEVILRTKWLNLDCAEGPIHARFLVDRLFPARG